MAKRKKCLRPPPRPQEMNGFGPNPFSWENFSCIPGKGILSENIYIT